MKRKYLATLMVALTCSFIASAPICAGEMAKPSNKHVPIRMHALSLDEENELREYKAKEDEENLKLQDQIPESEHPVCDQCKKKNPPENKEEAPLPESEHLACDQCKKKPPENKEEPQPAEEDKVTNGAYYYSSHPDGYHQALSIATDGSAIETEDNAIYTVKWSDRHKTCNWQNYHTILLAPNRSWFSSYYFKLINLDTGEKASVNMTLGPVYENVKTHWIEAIDYDNRTIRLEDNSFWSMSWLDQGALDTLDRYDVVIIGTNDGWWKASNPNVLIAVKSFQYVRGAKLN